MVDANNASSRVYRRAAIAVFVLGAYLQIVEWVDLFPWNNVRNGNGQETLDIVLCASMLIIVLLLWRGWRIAAVVATASLLAWAWLQLTTWWLPYFRGASQGWARTYEHWFSETISWMPRDANHLPPDANHLVLHILIVVAMAMCLLAALTPGWRRTALC
jgi:hypothetical protein